MASSVLVKAFPRHKGDLWQKDPKAEDARSGSVLRCGVVTVLMKLLPGTSYLPLWDGRGFGDPSVWGSYVRNFCISTAALTPKLE